MVSLTSPTRTIEQRPLEAVSPVLKVLAFIDGTDRTGRIIDYVIGLKRRVPALKVVVLGVVQSPPTGRLRGYGTFKQAEIHDGLIATMRQRAVSSVARRLDYEKVTHIDRIEVGDPAATILKVAREEDADLILLGDGPPNLLQRLLPEIGLTLATVTNQILQRASVPVVVVK
jgi:nucleotide-binding universal stress UspA family protein